MPSPMEPHQPGLGTAPVTPDSVPEVQTGVHGGYHWITISAGIYIGTLLRHYPELVLGKYLAATSHDSGIYPLSPADEQQGWTLRGDIAYSPRIQTTAGLQYQSHGPDGGGFDEWYIFAQPSDLGTLCRGNPFEEPHRQGRVIAFVNMYLSLHNVTKPWMDQVLPNMFWQQMEWIKPITYLSDGADCVTVATTDHGLVERIQRWAVEELAKDESVESHPAGHAG